MPRIQCSQCLRPQTVCYCHTLQIVENQWPVFIWQHPQEARHPLGTARIAQLSLKQCALLNDGEPRDRQYLHAIITGKNLRKTPLLVFPGENSLPLEEVNRAQIQRLLFIDGSWRKAKRLLLENPALSHLPRVQLNPSTPSLYRIRQTRLPGALSTLEAIVETLTYLEQEPTKYQPLLYTMDWMIEQQIKAMGSDVFERNYSRRF